MKFPITLVYLICSVSSLFESIECQRSSRINRPYQPNQITDPCAQLKCSSEEICIADSVFNANCIPISSVNIFSESHFLRKRQAKQIEVSFDPCGSLNCTRTEICKVNDAKFTECLPLTSISSYNTSHFLHERNKLNKLKNIAARRVFSSKITHTFLSPCLTDPCRHGHCEILNLTTHDCHCHKGVTGNNCNFLSTSKNPCKSNPCYGQSACINLSDEKFVCICRAGRAGPTCQGHSAPCQCANNATCQLVELDVFNCSCPQGYGGHLCQFKLVTEYSVTNEADKTTTQIPELITSSSKEIDMAEQITTNKDIDIDGDLDMVDLHAEQESTSYCTPDTCQNGGTCLQVNPSQALCLCPQNFRGAFCSSNLPQNKTTRAEVQPNPNNSTCPKPLKNVCLNGGICHEETKSTITTFKCVCKPGYIGTFCDQIEPYCYRNDRCKNGGTCYQIDAVKGKCGCKPKFKGLMCEIGLGCDSNPCKNNQPCLMINGEPKCICIDGNNGPDCHSIHFN